MEIILTHQNADFDAVASMLGAYKLNPSAIPILPSRQHNTVSEFLKLYRNGLPFVRWEDFRVATPITQITLTDTQHRLEIANLPDHIPTLIIDHHSLDRPLLPHETWAGEPVGAASTLLVERIKERHIALNSLESTLLALGIYSDTGMFTYGGTTVRDIQAVAWLMNHGVVLDMVRRFLTNPLTAEQQMLFELLLNQAEHRSINGYTITICEGRSEHVIDGINTVTYHLQDILSSEAIFVLVAMPQYVQLVCRSGRDEIHVGLLAQQFGGGGHVRAAAAAIYKKSLETIRTEIWDFLNRHVMPAIRVLDLMSYGVQTVQANNSITVIAPRLRRIGHEGFPVLDDGLVVGLLTLRDVDRALEHSLTDVEVKDVMHSGQHVIYADDPVSRLEEIMVRTDWGQIPVVDSSNHLIGIVTRTDLIKHWGKMHPDKTVLLPSLTSNDIKAILGDDHLHLINQVADYANHQQITLYMVGGVVRDLLLKRANYDIDFVIEYDAIQFAEALQAKYGGRIHSHVAFRTAKWYFDAESAHRLGVKLDAIPEYLDFATARSELYEHPTALPQIYQTGIKLDLRRRDFTINTLAVQLSPADMRWHILDFYGGIKDVNERVIRVLHSLSFVDDPTRILRAIRFSERLQFTIEPRTTELIQTALPMLRRITGERIQNELSLLLEEQNSARGFMKLEALGALSAIHQEFKVTPKLIERFDNLANSYPQWTSDLVRIRWHLLLMDTPAKDVFHLCRRLLFNESDAYAMQQSVSIAQNPSILIATDTKPSQIDALLASLKAESLLAIWLSTSEPMIRERLEKYHNEWKNCKPITTGHTLIEMGLPRGPEYRIILERLRIAWLDQEIQSESEETVFLHALINEIYND